MHTTKKMDILNCVVENARVLAHEDGSFITASLEAEIIFEAGDRGYDEEEVNEAVQFALDHSNHHE